MIDHVITVGDVAVVSAGALLVIAGFGLLLWLFAKYAKGFRN